MHTHNGERIACSYNKLSFKTRHEQSGKLLQIYATVICGCASSTKTKNSGWKCGKNQDVCIALNISLQDIY